MMESGTEQRYHQYAWEPVKVLKNKREGKWYLMAS